MSINLTRPKNFNSLFDVVSCFIEYEEKILLLHRQDEKPEGNKWCLPSGKIDKENGESAPAAILREVKEETDLEIKKIDLFYNGQLYVRYPTHDFTFLTFTYFSKEKPAIKLNEKEHKEYKWISPKEALNLLLVRDFNECIKLYYRLK